MTRFPHFVYSLLLVLLIPFAAFCQNASEQMRTNGVMIGVGPAMLFKDSRQYDAWVRTNDGHQRVSDVGIAVNLMLVVDEYEFGFNAPLVADYQLPTFLIGKEMYHEHKLTQYLDISAGQLFVRNKHTVPPGYILYPDEENKKMMLDYRAFCIGLASRTIFALPNKRGNDRAFCGLNLQVGFLTGNGKWKYEYEKRKDDYYDENGASTEYHGHRVYGVPSFGRVVFSASFIVGFGGPRTETYVRRKAS